jgi:copper chaperone
MQRAILDIQGMSCGHCLNAVNRALSALPGVEIDSVAIGRADIRFDETVTSPAQLEAAVGSAGYPAKIRP